MLAKKILLFLSTLAISNAGANFSLQGWAKDSRDKDCEDILQNLDPVTEARFQSAVNFPEAGIFLPREFCGDRVAAANSWLKDQHNLNASVKAKLFRSLGSALELASDRKWHMGAKRDAAWNYLFLGPMGELLVIAGRQNEEGLLYRSNIKRFLPSSVDESVRDWTFVSLPEGWVAPVRRMTLLD